MEQRGNYPGCRELFSDQPRPEGVVISFDQWAEYEAMKDEAELEQRTERTTRERLANAGPEGWVSFEDAAREGGWDLDVESDEDKGGRTSLSSRA